jgi:hypothetical protein
VPSREVRTAGLTGGSGSNKGATSATTTQHTDSNPFNEKYEMDEEAEIIGEVSYHLLVFILSPYQNLGYVNSINSQNAEIINLCLS